MFDAEPNYVTNVSLTPLATDPAAVDVRFETTFAKAKDPSYRQTKGQHFINKADLQLLRDQINDLLSTEDLSKPLSAGRGAK